MKHVFGRLHKLLVYIHFCPTYVDKNTNRVSNQCLDTMNIFQ